MTGTPGREVFDDTQTGMYHCINRCSRLAFIRGKDPSGGPALSPAMPWEFHLRPELPKHASRDLTVTCWRLSTPGKRRQG